MNPPNSKFKIQNSKLDNTAPVLSISSIAPGESIGVVGKNDAERSRTV